MPRLPNTNPERCRRTVVSATIQAVCLLTIAVTLAPTSRAQHAFTEPLFDYTNLSLEDLFLIEISSVSRRPESLFTAAAAVHVITASEIERIGAYDLPEALRLVPGIQVAQIDSSNWAVTARGFNDVYANKLLMMADGRTLYTKLFSGTLWNHAPIFMPDLDRIEVIRGPGATLWGANAVNGVINAVSKNAHDTLGGYFSAAIGDNLNAAVNARYGWTSPGGHATRVYASFHDAGNLGAETDPDRGDWERRFVGVRHDWRDDAGRQLTITLEGRELEATSTAPDWSLLPPYSIPVLNEVSTEALMLMGRWVQPVGDDGEWSTQAFVEHVNHQQHIVGTEFTVFDIDSQFQLQLADRQELTLGLNAHRETDDVSSTPFYSVTPASDTTDLLSAFAQYSRPLGEYLKLTVGSKFEHHTYTGWEIQPGVRAAWTPSEKHTVWASIAHAVRTPSRAERGSVITTDVIDPTPLVPLPTQVALSGVPSYGSEDLLAFELGYRVQVSDEFSVDVALFNNEYSNLRSTSTAAVSTVLAPIPHVFADFQICNNIDGRTYGGEVNFRWRPVHSISIDASYATIRYDLNDSLAPGQVTPAIAIYRDFTPTHEAKLHAAWHISDELSFDAFVNHRSELPGAAIPAYTGVDARLAWSPRPGQRWEIIGKNLTDPRHAEFSGTSTFGGGVSEIDRSVFLKFTTEF